MFVGGGGGGRCRGTRRLLSPFLSPRLPGLLPSPVPKDGEGEASSRARILPSARGGDRGLTRTCAPCSSGDAALEGAATGPGRPSVPPGGGVWRATGLGTTLGRACSRGCRERKVRSKIGWLAGSRDSHHVSRFAAFFILAGAEISVDGSCFEFLSVEPSARVCSLFPPSPPFPFSPCGKKKKKQEKREKGSGVRERREPLLLPSRSPSPSPPMHARKGEGEEHGAGYTDAPRPLSLSLSRERERERGREASHASRRGRAAADRKGIPPGRSPAVDGRERGGGGFPPSSLSLPIALLRQ
jgi:hypothetical protein